MSATTGKPQSRHKLLQHLKARNQKRFCVSKAHAELANVLL